MRPRTIVVVGLMVVATAAACGKGGGEDPAVATAQSAGATVQPSASASVSEADDGDRQLKFAQCMREQGMTWFPDPSDGKLSVHVPSEVKPGSMEAAEKACRKWAPGGENGPKMSAEDIEKARNMAKCMRENGVPNFPDPQADGGIRIDSKMGIDPDSASFQAAQKKCDQLGPGGGEQKKNDNVNGVGTA